MRLNDIFDRIVVINLDSRTDRMEAFDEQAKKYALEYIRFPAVPADPPNLLPSWACKASHQAVIKQAVEDKVKRLFVFEDDAQFVDNFNEKLEDVYSKIPEDWDMFYLGAWHLEYRPYAEGVVKMIESYSAHAYGINEHYLQEAYSQIYLPKFADVALSLKHPHIKAFCAKPALVGQTPGYSDIEKEYRDVTEHYL